VELVYACVLGVLAGVRVPSAVVIWRVAFHKIRGTASEDDILGILFQYGISEESIYVLWEEEEGGDGRTDRAE
jgi:hypothetical protein